MLDEPLGAADAVADDRVALDARQRPVDEHEGDSEARRAAAGARAERSLTGAITIPSTRWAISSSTTSRSTRRSARVSQRMTR